MKYLSERQKRVLRSCIDWEKHDTDGWFEDAKILESILGEFSEPDPKIKKNACPECGVYVKSGVPCPNPRCVNHIVYGVKP